jgi:hypothetical protein
LFGYGANGALAQRPMGCMYADVIRVFKSAEETSNEKEVFVLGNAGTGMGNGVFRMRFRA